MENMQFFRLQPGESGHLSENNCMFSRYFTKIGEYDENNCIFSSLELRQLRSRTQRLNPNLIVAIRRRDPAFAKCKLAP
jgi:hypothetical protein